MSDLRTPDFSKLIPLEEYVSIEHAVPYQYILKNSGAEMRVFGADHSNDPDHNQFVQLKTMMGDNQSSCVLLEGLQDEVTFAHLHELIAEMDEEEAIIRGGEAVYAAYLALEAGVSWQSVEPADKDLYQYLDSLGFSREEIVIWSNLRLLPQYLRRNETLSFEDYLEPFRDQFYRATNWSEAKLPLTDVWESACAIVGSTLSFTNEEQAIRYVSPLAVAEQDNDYTVLNTIAATANTYRDRVMIKEVLSALENFESVLVVYGASHAVMQEPVWRDLLDK